MKSPAPHDLIAVSEIDRVTLPNEVAAHRLIDRLHDAHTATLPQAVNE